MKMDNRKKDAGISLVELIVVISIMAVLGGVVGPQVVRHVNTNRATACRTDREAILAIYERCIYGQKKSLDTAALQTVLSGGDATTRNEVQQYDECPQGGSYTGEVLVNTTTDVYTAVIHCSHTGHEDAVVDFIGWGTAEREESTEDVTLPPPPSSEEEEEEESSTEEPSSTVEEAKKSYWPYMDDERWEGKKFPGQSVIVDAPSGLLTSKEGNVYVIVDTDGTGKFEIFWEWNLGPENIDTRGWDRVVSWSGVVIEDLTAFKHPRSETQLTGINYGDIVVYNGQRYIYGNKNYGGKDAYINYPIPGQNGNDFYLVDPPEEE